MLKTAAIIKSELMKNIKGIMLYYKINYHNAGVETSITLAASLIKLHFIENAVIAKQSAPVAHYVVFIRQSEEFLQGNLVMRI